MRSIMPAAPALPPRLHLLLPFALPCAADAQYALQDLEKPALEKLLDRATLAERVVGEDFQRTLPHERWMARAFDATAAKNGAAADDEAPLAPYMMLADGADPRDAIWACVEPVHVQVAHDHLVLIDPQALELSTEEAAELLATARPLIDELGIALSAPTPLRWYVSSESLGSLAGAAPLRAAGRNIEIWLPHEAHTGARSRAWMKLQNEVQMAWFEHPVNVAREARGLPAANSIWLHAQGRRQALRRAFALVLSDAVASRGLALAADAQIGAAPASFEALRRTLAGAPGAWAAGPVLVELDMLSAAFIQQDWHRFRAGFAALEAHWFAPALAALQRGELAGLALTLCGDTGSATLNITPRDLRKFWRRRPFTSLLLE
jgi:hypothetical protein